MRTAALPLLPPLLPAAPRRALVLATAAALGLHAVLLLGWPSFNTPVRAGASHGTVTTRVIVQAPPAPPAPPEPPAPEPTPAPPPPPPTPRPDARPAPKPAPTPAPRQATPPKPASAPATARGAAGGSDSLFASLLDAPPLASFGGTRPDVPFQPPLDGEDARLALQWAATGEPLPAVVPRGATLTYQASGTLNGQPVQGDTTLAWRRTDAFYEADWQSPARALSSWQMASSGLIAEQGLLPVLAGPRTGGAQPARFDYAARAVHFPPTDDQPEARADLPPGTQDALSAIVQLGAWLAGDASRFAPGQTFTLPVANGGSVRPWRWFVAAAEEQTPVTALGGRPVPAVHLTHVPLGEQAAHAPRIELWLSPALDHLPVRMALTWPNGDTLTQLASAARLNRAASAP
ncbi:MAG: DUF3108 domain-containing protein [Pseudomonadota bacterium]|nr:DUF3108 domain-containing protein [Pseudomonadota bacterium]